MEFFLWANRYFETSHFWDIWQIPRRNKRIDDGAIWKEERIQKMWPSIRVVLAAPTSYENVSWFLFNTFSFMFAEKI